MLRLHCRNNWRPHGHIEIDLKSPDAIEGIGRVVEVIGNDVDLLGREAARLTAEVAALRAALESVDVRIA